MSITILEIRIDTPVCKTCTLMYLSFSFSSHFLPLLSHMSSWHLRRSREQGNFCQHPKLGKVFQCKCSCELFGNQYLECSCKLFLLREAARKAEQLEAVTVPADLPEPAVGRAGVGVKGGGQANGGERRKTLGQGKGLKHSSRSEASETTPRSSKKKSTGGPLSVARPDAITRPPARAPALPPALPRALPQLPTTPIPKGELPPMSIRSPPLLSGPPNPLLSSLTPLPPSKTYAKPSTTPVSTSAAAPQSQLISIQVC